MLALVITVIILIIINILLISIIIIYNKNLKTINIEFNNIISTDTNQEISLSTRNKNYIKFVKELNKNIKRFKKLRNHYYLGNDKLKKAIIDLSHDLRTPITVIIGYLNILRENGNYNKELEIIERRVDELKMLVGDLFKTVLVLDLNVQVQEFNVITILQEVLLSFYPNLNEAKIDVTVSINDDNINILANKEAIIRVFNNIFSNAIKYVSYDLIVSEKDNIIKIANHTDKLDNVKVAKIFDRYYTVRDLSYSTCLGFDIAKTIIEKYGYKISARYVDDLFELIIDFNK